MSRARDDMHRNAGVALVTGSRRGIGLGIAVELAKAGFNLVLNGTASPEDSREAIEEVRSAAGYGLYVQADISQREGRERLISQVKETFGQLNVLVNNAGVAPQPRMDMLKAPEESFDRVISINLKGPYFLTRDVAIWMIQQRQKDPDRKLRIINISSISSFTASPSRGEYCLSKAAMSMMTSLFAVRLAEYGIGVFEIRPGIVKTDMTAPVRDRYEKLISEGLTPIARWGVPGDIGRAVVALAMDYFPFSTGDVINVDGGFHIKTL